MTFVLAIRVCTNYSKRLPGAIDLYKSAWGFGIKFEEMRALVPLHLLVSLIVTV